MDADAARLLKHVQLCHSIIVSLVEIIDALWENIDDPTLKEHPNAERLEKLMATIRRVTADPKEQN